MTTITFASAAALSTFHAMIEGMAEIAQDDGDTARAETLLDLIPATAATSFPATTKPLTYDLIEQAEAVLENCLDCSSGATRDDDDADTLIFAGDVTINA